MPCPQWQLPLSSEAIKSFINASKSIVRHDENEGMPVVLTIVG
jgi:hypothetical protein